MPRLILASSNRRIRQSVLPALLDREALLIANSKGSADELLWSESSGSLGVRRLTLPQVAAQLATTTMAELGLSPMTAMAQQALVARAVHYLRPALNYFREISDTPGFVRAATATLSELRMNFVDPDRLASTGAPGEDLAKLLRAYEELRQEAALADQATFFRLALGPDTHPLLGLPLVLLDVAVRNRASMELVAFLAAKAPECTAVVLEGDTESATALTASLGVPVECITDSEEESAIGRVRRFLFHPDPPPVASLDPTLSCFSSPGESFECVEIVRRIQALAAEGMPFDRMAILLRNPERYQPLVEEALRRGKVPGWFSHGTLRPDPAGRAFLALLACAQDGLSASRFVEYLSLAQVPALEDRRDDDFTVESGDEVLSAMQGLPQEEAVPREDTQSPAVPIGWEQMVVDAAVIGGRDRWERRLRGLRQQEEDKLQSSEDMTETRRAAIARRVEQLERLEDFALPVIGRLDRLPGAATWGEWVSALRDLSIAALRDPDPVLAVLTELLPMADVGPVSLDEVFSVLHDRLGTLRRRPPLRRFGAVFVGTIDEARGRTFDAVFLPGLAEGLFPKRLSEDPLLLDDYRAPLQLPRNDTRADRERLLLRVAIAAGDRLVVSYPRMDTGQARPRVPSFYLLEVIRAAEGRLPDLNQLAERTRKAAAARLGWPAPETPNIAIDDVEYDLAVLGEIQRAANANDPGPRGRAKYMLQASETLARSLRSRYLRWKRKWSSADGIVQPQPALESHRLTERPHSATSLERFARCPYQFFLHAVHRLEPREEPAAIEQMDPLTRGTIFHEAVAAILTRLQPWQARSLPDVLDLVDNALNEIAARHAEELAPAIPRVWESEIENLRTDLRGWIREVVSSPWTPLEVERTFESVSVGEYRLNGRIDLVERHATSGALRITDHKTGKRPDKRPAYLGGGTVLQPVLYSMAFAAQEGRHVSTGRLYYCTQRGGYEEAEIPITETAQQHALAALNTIDRAIANGLLVAAPAEKACDICDYKIVCGPYEEQRILRKDKGGLLDLIQLRETP